MSRILTDKMKNCEHPEKLMWPDGSCPHCGWNKWIQYFETQEEVDQFKHEKELSSKGKKDLVKEYLALERQLEEAREENKSKEALISQTSKICLLLQMGKVPSQDDFRELMSLERAYRTFEEF